MKIVKFWVRTASLILSFIFTLILNSGEAPPKENYLEPLRIQNYLVIDALLRGQGVTTDGVHYYFSSNYGLLKTELDGTTWVESNIIAIPYDLLKIGCNHIGGITYYDGKIYAPIEDGGEHENVFIAVYDSETLKLIKYSALPKEYHPRGVPWCIADGTKGYLYAAPPDNITEINVYDINTLEFIKKLPISQAIDNIQGGDMYDGIIYVSVSREDQAIYAINSETGEVKKAISRNLAGKSEGEDVAVLKTDDGAFFHVLNIGNVKVGSHFRHYAFDPSSLQF